MPRRMSIRNRCRFRFRAIAQGSLAVEGSERHHPYQDIAMAGYYASHDQRPITYWGRVPVYAIGIITAAYAVGFILCVLLISARIPLDRAVFEPAAFVRGAIWQPLTFSFIGRLDFFTPLSLICLYAWGVEVERHVGRTRFLAMFALILAAQVLVGMVWWLLLGAPVLLAGSYQLVAALLIAFAALYPNIEYFGWIPLKWFAFACFSIGSLMYFPARDWIGLTVLWAACGAAFGCIRWLQQGRTLGLSEQMEKLLRRRPKFSVVRPEEPARPRARAERDPVESIDAILEKISKSGMASLTAREHATLEKAREALMKKEPESR